MLSPKIGATNGNGLTAASGALWGKELQGRKKQESGGKDGDEAVSADQIGTPFKEEIAHTGRATCGLVLNNFFDFMLTRPLRSC